MKLLLLLLLMLAAVLIGFRIWLGPIQPPAIEFKMEDANGCCGN